MLNAIRKQAGSWIVKILLLLLVASFAVWGIGDIFYSGQRNPVIATVGDSDVHASELANAFSRQLNEAQRRLGTGIDRRRAIQLGLMDQALQDLIARRLIDLRAHEMGLTVDEATLRQMIVDNPLFQSGGRFDRHRFEQILLANGLNEETYLAALRQEAVRSTLTESLTAPITVPETLVESIYSHRNEQRRGQMLRVRAGAIEEVPAPTEADLEAYHAEHEERFRAPEYRAITFVTIEPEDALEEVAVAPEAIESAYEERRARYQTPERRSIEQLVAPERAVIEEAEERIARGARLAEVQQALAAEGLALSELVDIAPGELPAALDAAVFGLAEGEVGEPVESPLGWHLVKLTALDPERVTPLAEVRDEIERELALEEANARLPAFANALDDELAAGATLEAAAAAVGLEVHKVDAVDADGRDPEGERPATLPGWPAMLELAFATPAGETSLVEETREGAFFVLRVDEVIPSRIRPLEEVREEVAAAWRAAQRRDLAKARAEELLARIREARTLEGVATEAGLEPVPIEPVRRADRGTRQGVNRAVVEALFETPEGEVAEEVIEVGGGFAVVATTEVIPADASADAEGLEQLEAELEAEMRGDLLAQFGRALRDAYPVEIHQAELERLRSNDGALPQGTAAPMPHGGMPF